MRRVHEFAKRAFIATGGVLAFVIVSDIALVDWPVTLANAVFAAFGLSLAVFAFTYKRWTPDAPPPDADGRPDARSRKEDPC